MAEGVYIDSSYAYLTDVSAAAQGGSTNNIGINLHAVTGSLTDVNASAVGTGTSTNNGIFINAYEPALSNVTATASGGSAAYGIHTYGGSPVMTSVTASASGASNNYGP